MNLDQVVAAYLKAHLPTEGERGHREKDNYIEFIVDELTFVAIMGYPVPDKVKKLVKGPLHVRITVTPGNLITLYYIDNSIETQVVSEETFTHDHPEALFAKWIESTPHYTRRRDLIEDTDQTPHYRFFDALRNFFHTTA